MRERVGLVLVHHPTLDREGRVVTSAVTPLDVHDLARLARTYGLDGLYVATPLEAQQALVQRVLAHWTAGYGGQVNPCRREALERVRLCRDLAEAASAAEARWGASPWIVGTSAREGAGRMGFAEARNRLAALRAPALVVFGTGWGLADEVLAACDAVLEPVRGPGPYNHLSVRSAAAIVVDRLFGRGGGETTEDTFSKGS